MMTEERGHLLALLETCGSLLSNQGCNDFPVPNTDANWRTYEAMRAWNMNLSVEKWRKSSDASERPAGERIYFMDWFLLAYLAHLIQTEGA